MIDWIDEQICNLSSDPPASCPPRLPTIRPLSQPSMPPARFQSNLALMIEIATDDFPQDVSWSLSTVIGINVAIIPEGTYQRKRTVERETVTVTPGVSYVFLISDSQGDGICCSHGGYRLYLDLDGTEIVLASNNGQYRQNNIVQFTVPSSSNFFPTSRPSQSPSGTPNERGPDEDGRDPPTVSLRPSEAPSIPPSLHPTISSAPTTLQVITNIRIEILTDKYPLEVGYSIKENFNDRNIVASVPRGSFSREDSIEIRTYVLLGGAEYQFRITDYARDGICCEYGNGRYRIVAELYGQDLLLALSGGNYGGSELQTFVVPPRFSTPAPTSAPTMMLTTTAPVPGPTPFAAREELFLTIVLRLDAWPEETGWTLQNKESQDEVIAQRFIGTYRGMGYQLIQERVDLTYTSGYDNDDLAFVLLDEIGNGMCCGAYFEIYRGEPSGGVLLVSGDGNFGMSSVHTIPAVGLRSEHVITNSTNTTDLTAITVNGAEVNTSITDGTNIEQQQSMMWVSSPSAAVQWKPRRIRCAPIASMTSSIAALYLIWG